jgi:hypothetical protein
MINVINSPTYLNMYYAILVGCNKNEPEILAISDNLIDLKGYLLKKYNLTDDLIISPDDEVTPENDYIMWLDTMNEQLIYSNLKKEQLRKLSKCTCSANVYVVRDDSNVIDIRDLMNIVKEVVI